ncbi:GDSL esterase/lipase At4g26790-like isoform X2 [Magnolia sinica]|uniref:GDSL esterase/lipase At4g26790-like isoform X2 n=1 Tax=Magnolia sinica TaxID=86752 RepID=UPI00265912E0|nr:GDSL esterase/lipase At4g26790-like isoform X2 [Magnolia sinica]
MAHSNTFLFLLFLQIPLSCIGIRDGPPTKVPAVIVFGDSSVDAGNNNHITTILKSNFEPYGRDFWDARPTGRFSNGRIAPDFISEAFGIKPAVPAYLDPTYSIKDFVDGVCFASAGTGYDNATSNVLNVIPLWQELVHFKEYQTKLRSYVGDQEATYILTEALYLISVGTNDFLENYYTVPGRRSQFTINGYQDFLVGIAESFVKAIYDLGGRKISLGGIPPMGCLPLERTMNFMHGSDCREDYNVVARDFNGKLQALVARLNQELLGIRLVYSDIYDTLLELVQMPYLIRECSGRMLRDRDVRDGLLV